MGRHSFSQKNRSVIRYLLIILVFVLLALGVYLFFKCRIKMMERENEPGVHTEQQKQFGTGEIFGEWEVEQLMPERIPGIASNAKQKDNSK